MVAQSDWNPVKRIDLVGRLAPLFGKRSAGQRKRRRDSGYVKLTRNDWSDRESWYAGWHISKNSEACQRAGTTKVKSLIDGLLTVTR
jgi:hypothetical protein